MGSLLAALLLAQALITAGVQVNPGGGTVLADSGAASANTGGQVCVVISASVAATVALEVRDATNTSTLFSQTFWVTAAFPIVAWMPVTLAASQRVRLTLGGIIVGSIQGSIMLGNVGL